MKIDKPNNFTQQHADFLIKNKNLHNSEKVNKLVEKFGVSVAEATIFVLYWEKK